MNRKRSLFNVLAMFGCSLIFQANAQVTHRDIMSSVTVQQIKEHLVPMTEWHPFPGNAGEWAKALSQVDRRQIIDHALKLKDIPYTHIPASVFLEYVRTGDRNNYQLLSFAKRQQLFSLILAEAIEGQGRFADAIADGVWNICEETYWGVPAHLFAQKAGSGLPDAADPTVDIFAAETAALLALADYLAGPAMDKVSPLLRKRIVLEVDKRILLPLEQAADRYRHLGARGKDVPVNNWNPWIISNWMTALLLLEKNEDRRAKELHHALTLLDLYVNGLGEDGSCDEGPEYWFAAGGALFDALYIFQDATGNNISLLPHPFVQKIGAYIYKTYIGEQYFINVADAHPRIKADAILLYRFGRSVNDSTFQYFGSWLSQQPNSDSITSYARFHRPRTLFNLVNRQDCLKSTARQPDLNSIWLSDIQLMASRTANGLFIAAHGGHNNESHNHNDVGDFIIYKNGKPLIIDAGSGTYTSATFSDKRYELWYNTSAYHNLPGINKTQQGAGAEYKAVSVHYKHTKATDQLAMNIAPAYPADAKVVAWIREWDIFKTKNRIIITDKYHLRNTANEISQHFLSPLDADIDKPGVIQFNTGDVAVKLKYDPKQWKISKEIIHLNRPDEKGLEEGWGQKQLWRFILTSQPASASGIFTYVIE